MMSEDYNIPELIGRARVSLSSPVQVSDTIDWKSNVYRYIENYGGNI